MDKRGLFRVNYFDVGGQPKTGFVVAFTDVEAGQFLGVASASGIQITRDRYPVEVAGLDDPHATIADIPPSKAEFDLPKSVSREDFNALKAQLDALVVQMNLRNTPASPAPTISGEPTPVQADPLPKE